MTIYTATQQQAQMLAWLESCAEAEIDLSGVAEIDTAGVQVLLAIKAEARRQDRTLNLVNHSQPVVEVLELLDIQAQLGDPVVLPAGWSES